MPMMVCSVFRVIQYVSMTFGLSPRRTARGCLPGGGAVEVVQEVLPLTAVVFDSDRILAESLVEREHPAVVLNDEGNTLASLLGQLPLPPCLSDLVTSITQLISAIDSACMSAIAPIPPTAT